jgi:hypothetical protein
VSNRLPTRWAISISRIGAFVMAKQSDRGAHSGGAKSGTPMNIGGTTKVNAGAHAGGGKGNASGSVTKGAHAGGDKGGGKK